MDKDSHGRSSESKDGGESQVTKDLASMGPNSHQKLHPVGLPAIPPTAPFSQTTSANFRSQGHNKDDKDADFVPDVGEDTMKINSKPGNQQDFSRRLDSPMESHRPDSGTPPVPNQNAIRTNDPFPSQGSQEEVKTGGKSHALNESNGHAGANESGVIQERSFEDAFGQDQSHVKSPMGLVEGQAAEQAVDASQSKNDVSSSKHDHSSFARMKTYVKQSIRNDNDAKYNYHGKTQVFDRRSLFLFAEQNCLRKKLVWLIEWRWFDYFITVCIIINSILLACQDYQGVLEKDYVSERNALLKKFDVVLSIIFLGECFCKVLSMGFMIHKKSYLRDVWNWLDFFVVCISVFDLLPGQTANQNLKALRTLRILRPLRTINSMPRMKDLIQSLIKSLPGLVGVVFFLCFAFAIFAIFGVHQFMGAQYQRCRMTEEPELKPGSTDEYLPWEINYDVDRLCSSDAMCKEYLPDAKVHKCGKPLDFNLPVSSDGVNGQELISFDIINFNNLMKGMLTIFQALTLEGWSLMMYNMMDANVPTISICFFCSLVIFGAFFTMNLVLAQIMDSFYSQQKDKEMILQKETDKQNDLTPAQILQKQIEDHKQTMELQAIQSEENLVANKAAIDQSISPRPHPVDDAAGAQNLSQYIDDNVNSVNRVMSPIATSEVSGSLHLPQIRKQDTIVRNEALNVIGKYEDRAIAGEAIRQSQDSNFKNDIQNSQPNMSEGPESVRPVSQKQNKSLSQSQCFDQSGVAAPTNAKDADLQKKLQELEGQKSSENPEFSSQNQLRKQVTLQYGEMYQDEDENDYNARTRSHKNSAYRFFYLIVTHPFFNFMIFCLIILNTVTLAMDDYPRNASKDQFLHICNEFFTWTFFAEMILKMVGLGIKNYSRDKFNLFDAVVVMLSIVDWTISKTVNEEEIGGAGEALQAFRAMRLLRVIKVARQWTALQEILSKTMKSLKDISNFSLLLFLCMYIYALLGMEIFANIARFSTDGDLITDLHAATASGVPMLAPRENFDNIFKALTTIFIVIIGEDWNQVMYIYVRVLGTDNEMWVSLYFVSLMIIGNVMLLSLFTAILLQNFEQGNDKKDGDSEGALDKSNPKAFVSSVWTKAHSIFMDAFGAKRKRKANSVSPKQKLYDSKVIPASPKSGADTPIPAEQKLKDKLKQQSIKKPVLEEIEEKNAEEVIDPAPVVQELPEADPPVSGKQRPKSEQRVSSNRSSQNRKDTFKDKNKNMSQSLMHYEGIILSPREKTKSALEDEVLIGRSLFILGKTNKLRVWFWKVMNNKWFDRVVLILIGVSTATLAFETPLDNPNGKKIEILSKIDYAMTSAFLIEALIKILAVGFLFNGKSSYLRNAWNILDFAIVCSSILTILPFGVDLSFTKSLRALRVLRPLRLVQRIKGLKLAITSLFNSIPNILNLLLIVVFFIFLLAILGTTLFAGKFYYCDNNTISLTYRQQEELIKTKWDCLNYGGEWVNPDLHFDNVFSSMLTLLTIQTTEGWIGVMWSAVDSSKVDQVPIINNNWYYVIFFMMLVVIICLLFLNLFVGVVIETFNSEKEHLSLNHLLRHIERQWIAVQIQTYSAKPFFKVPKSRNALRNFCIQFCQNDKFDQFILICIFLNTILLTIKWYDMPTTLVLVIEYMNYVFMFIFTVEAIVKIIALKSRYFKDSWNIFDFVVVIGTLLVLVVSFFDIGIDLGVQSTILRSLRIGRVFRIVKRAQKLQIIFQTLIESLPSMASLGLLLLLLLFLYAIIGVSQFGLVQQQEGLNWHANFKDFGTAFLLLMRCSTGEAWNMIMFDSARQRSILFQCEENTDYETYMENGGVTTGCGYQGVSVFFFLSFQVIVSQIFLNLFIAIIIDSFIGQSDAFNLPINENDIETFTSLWEKFDQQAKGFIDCKRLEEFLVELAKIENCNLVNYKKKIVRDVYFRRRFIASLEIPTFRNFRAFMFYDVLQTLCRSVVQNSYNREKIAENKEKLKVLKALKLQFASDESLSMAAKNVVMGENFTGEFEEMIANMGEKDKRIDLINQLKEKASKIQKKFSQDIDKALPPNQNEIYTSKHFIYGNLIVAGWRQFLRVKKMRRSSQLSDRQDRQLKRAITHTELAGPADTDVARAQAIGNKEAISMSTGAGRQGSGGSNVSNMTSLDVAQNRLVDANMNTAMSQDQNKNNSSALQAIHEEGDDNTLNVPSSRRSQHDSSSGNVDVNRMPTIISVQSEHSRSSHRILKSNSNSNSNSRVQVAKPEAQATPNQSHPQAETQEALNSKWPSFEPASKSSSNKEQESIDALLKKHESMHKGSPSRQPHSLDSDYLTGQPENGAKVNKEDDAPGISMDEEDFEEVLDTAFHNDKKRMR